MISHSVRRTELVISVIDSLKASLCLLTLQLKIQYTRECWTCQTDGLFLVISTFVQPDREDEAKPRTAGPCTYAKVK